MILLRHIFAALICPLILLHLVSGFFWVGGAALGSTRAGRAAATVWSRALLILFGVRLHQNGKPLKGALCVANHLSWLDIVALKASFDACFLSKAEVKSWPIIGLVASWLGTLFIGRGANGAAERATQQIAERLRAGETVIFFPEGRINQDRGLLPFRPRLFKAAYDAQALVQPVAIRYLSANGDLGHLVPEYNMLKSVWWLAGRRDVEVEITFLEPLEPADRPRRQIADESRARVARALG
ncbi:lysophospholipid acyltransferase family protein [Halorhodospira halochloris]|uniref:lysophospholipid acyltransferase family protein n=1 Tax=Halorhodospira halochloris TaxID=1052 RepID=UPI001EE936DD|nr:lysophospholipid acyltransferase family protein [Halorhodospira halochloris]MCG5547853.1 1-acyl-sn-glycerol-3-phosphate acyltransferase [Halorhodospira halochloris]